MKKINVFILFSMVTSFGVFANGGLGPDKAPPSRGTAGVDETYTDKLNTKNSSSMRQEETEKKLRQNPRNKAFGESFGQIKSKEDEQTRQEEKQE